MKNFIFHALVAACLLPSFTAFGQNINIPDANFKNALVNTLCVDTDGDGNVDTDADANNDGEISVSEALPITSLSVENRSIASLEGIHYFTSLQMLNCDGNQLTTLPTLPNGLTRLYCRTNQLTTLPTLPNGLTELYCRVNQLTALPILPNGLTKLYCRANQLTALPTLPNSLVEFSCGENQLTTLPTLPNNLYSFWCDNNQLTELPTLPNSMKALRCYNNQLTHLPTLPASLMILLISNNQLTHLPTLPSSLTTLNCYNNQITTLPTLPNGLTQLTCSNNPLHCLPTLPNTIDTFYTSNTLITCYPNHLPGITTDLPLCLPNNLDGCFAPARIYGTVYKDENANCTIETTDGIAPNILVKAINTATQEIYVATNTANGEYEIAVPAGTYQVSTVVPNAYWTNCLTQSVTITADGQQEERNLLLKPLVACADMSIQHQVNIARPCSTAVYNIVYLNEGTITSQGTYAEIAFPEELTLQTATLPYTALPNNRYRFQIGDVLSLEADTFSVSVLVSCAATMGEMLCTTAEILPHTYCSPPTMWDGSDIRLAGTCIGQDSIEFSIQNIGANGMQVAQSYTITEDNLMIRTGNFQLLAGGSQRVTVPADPNKIYRMIANESPNHPAQNVQETFMLWGCANGTDMHWGFVNQYPLNTGDNHIHRLCTEVRTSYDPNDISAVPTGTGDNHQILKGTDIEYKIRFQNTGNDTAFVVRITDLLPLELDRTTLRIGAASHPFTYTLHSNGALEFLFQNILLVDSMTNEPASHGYVTYSITAKNDLAIGTTINNQARIYFDANAPILTNTYTHTIGEINQLFTVSTHIIAPQNYGLKVMPNPMHEQAIFELTATQGELKQASLTLFNLLGQTLHTQSFNGNRLVLERNNLPQGCYFYTIQDNGKPIAQGKLVVE